MTATADARDDTGKQEHKLQRNLGPVGLLFAGIGSIIGSGWLFGAYNASALAGPAALFSWLLAAIMILAIGLTYAELGPMFPISGGVVRYPHLVWGSFASYSFGWITWISSAAVPAIEVEGALQYATRYGPFTSEHTVNGETTVAASCIAEGMEEERQISFDTSETNVLRISQGDNDGIALVRCSLP